MKTNNIIFNGKIYTFDSNLLLKFFERMVYNDNKEDDERKYVISFISDRFVMKSYDELDYHEFVIEGNFRVSQLLCNIENVFGLEIAQAIASEISKYLNDNIDVDTTDWFDSFSIGEILNIARLILDELNLNKFKELLAASFLYEAAQADYEQTIDDSENFRNLEFINGIGIRISQKEDGFILKPINPIYDSNESNYVKIRHVKLPVKVLKAVFFTIVDEDTIGLDKATADNFFLKFQQLTGSHAINKIPEIQKEFIGSIDHNIVGKWYSITKSTGFMSMYHINIHWFLEDGRLLKSIVFEMQLPNVAKENWGPKESSWLTNNDKICIRDAYSGKDSVKIYSVNDGALTIGDEILYNSFVKAKENVKTFDSPF